jgi:hypothetical protein
MPEKVIFHGEDCCVAIGIAVLDQFVGGATTVVAERDGSGGYTVTGQAGIDQICRDNSAAVEEMLPCREYHFEVLGRGTVLWRYEEGRVQSQEPSGEWHTHGPFTGVFNAGRRYEALCCGYPDIQRIRATRDEFARQLDPRAGRVLAMREILDEEHIDGLRYGWRYVGGHDWARQS